MPKLKKLHSYLESTAKDLLKPRVNNLVKEGGLDYKELNSRILADNRTENKPTDHNPIYGGINNSVCAVERQESVTLTDYINTFDEKCYTIEPRTVFVKTSDSSIVTDASGFFGDEITLNINELIKSFSANVLSLKQIPVEGSFYLDNKKLIIDESITNPWKINFSDEDNILLTINPYKQNVIPLIFIPDDEKLKRSFINVSLLIMDERQKAVIPEIKEGTYITVSALNSTNATSYKDKKGKLKTTISGSIVGDILDSETNQSLSSVSCDVLAGNEFPEMPTSYISSGFDEVSKTLNTLFAKVVIKQSSIRDVEVLLPIRYLADNRTELKPITSLTIEQTSALQLTYNNSGYTFRGNPCVVDSTNVSSLLSIDAQNADGSVTITVGDVLVEGSLNKDQKSTKATVSLTNSDDLVSKMTKEIEIEDNRPIRAKDVFEATENFSVTITSSDWNAGLKGQSWIGDSLTITGSLTKITNQFGREILPAEILAQSFTPIDVNSRIFSVGELNPIEILASDDVAGSTVAKAMLYVLTTSLEVISVPVELSVTDNR